MGAADALKRGLTDAWQTVAGGPSSGEVPEKAQTGLQDVIADLPPSSAGYEEAQSFPTSGSWTAYTPGSDQVSVDPSKDASGAKAAIDNGIARTASLINSKQFKEADAAYKQVFQQFQAYRSTHTEDKAQNQKWLTQITAVRTRLLAAEGKLKSSGFDKEAATYLRGQSGADAEQARGELHELSPRTLKVDQALGHLDDLDRMNESILGQRLEQRSFVDVAFRFEAREAHKGRAELIGTLRQVIQDGHATTVGGAITYLKTKYQQETEGVLVKGTDAAIEELKRIEALPTLPLNAAFLSKARPEISVDHQIDLADRLADRAGDYRESRKILETVLAPRLAEAGGDFKKLFQWQKEGKLSPEESRALTVYNEAFNPTRSALQISRVERDGMFDFATCDLPLMVPIFRAGSIVQGAARGVLGAGRLATGVALATRGGVEAVLTKATQGESTTSGEVVHAGASQTILHTVVQGVGRLPIPAFLRPLAAFGALTGFSAGERIIGDSEGQESVTQHIRDAAAHTFVSGTVAHVTSPSAKVSSPVVTEHSETILPPPPAFEVTAGARPRSLPRAPEVFSASEGSPMEQAVRTASEAGPVTMPPPAGYPDIIRVERGAPRPTPQTRAQLANGNFMSPGMVMLYAQKLASGNLTVTPDVQRPGYFQLSANRAPTIVVNEAAVKVIQTRAQTESARATLPPPANYPTPMSLAASRRPTVVAPAPVSDAVPSTELLDEAARAAASPTTLRVPSDGTLPPAAFRPSGTPTMRPYIDGDRETMPSPESPRVIDRPVDVSVVEMSPMSREPLPSGRSPAAVSVMPPASDVGYASTQPPASGTRTLYSGATFLSPGMIEAPATARQASPSVRGLRLPKAPASPRGLEAYLTGEGIPAGGIMPPMPRK